MACANSRILISMVLAVVVLCLQGCPTMSSTKIAARLATPDGTNDVANSRNCEAVTGVNVEHKAAGYVKAYYDAYTQRFCKPDGKLVLWNSLSKQEFADLYKGWFPFFGALNKSGVKVFDAGMGCGAFFDLVASQHLGTIPGRDHFPGFYGMDANEAAVNAAKEIFTESASNFYVGDLRGVPHALDGTMDLVASFGTMTSIGSSIMEGDDPHYSRPPHNMSFAAIPGTDEWTKRLPIVEQNVCCILRRLVNLAKPGAVVAVLYVMNKEQCANNYSHSYSGVNGWYPSPAFWTQCAADIATYHVHDDAPNWNNVGKEASNNYCTNSYSVFLTRKIEAPAAALVNTSMHCARRGVRGVGKLSALSN